MKNIPQNPALNPAEETVSRTTIPARPPTPPSAASTAK